MILRKSPNREDVTPDPTLETITRTGAHVMAAKEAAVITTETATQEAVVAAVTTADRLAETEVRDAITAAKADTLAANANNRRESADPMAAPEEVVAAAAEASTPVSVITADRRDT